MNAAPRDDRIEVSLAVTANRVVAVMISARRPVGIGRLAEGRDGDAVAALLPRLFALCGRAHSAAFAAACAMARGVVLPEPTMLAHGAAVLAERMSELLRGTLVALAGPALPSLAPALRQISEAARRFDGAALPDAAAIDAIEAGLVALGLPRHCLDDLASYQHWLVTNGPLAALHAALLTSDAAFGAVAIDALAARDDAAIGAALRQQGAPFAARPQLDGRVPETGALARQAAHPLIKQLGAGLGAGLSAGLGARLVARLIEIRATPDQLRAVLRGELPSDLVTAAPLAANDAIAAVEGARGRLHHLVALDPHGRVSQLEMLAPTEWNFHPQGALCRALSALQLRADGADQQRVERLVAAFDPCVAFCVKLTEATDA
ncbi:hydrogenase [Rhodopseudomonas pseudopalustris]|uniref:nickel-dependent hydrogenase large subunit n=1 Tax=Rhodopseudomonas pseudopalustris TaxID=1513892 RepID=UPI003F96B082